MQGLLGKFGNASLKGYFKNLEFQWGLNSLTCKEERKEKGREKEKVRKNEGNSVFFLIAFIHGMNT